MERRLAALEREQREQASSTRLLMELVEDSMPVAQCHELLASLEKRFGSLSAPATAVASAGRPAVADALRDDMDKLLRSQTKLEQETRGLSGRLDRVESSVRDQSHLKELERRIHDDLVEALGRELAEAVQEMADIAEDTQQSTHTLADRLKQYEDAATDSNERQKCLEERLEQHETNLAKLRETVQEAFVASEEDRKKEAAILLEDVEAFVTEQLDESERRQQQYTERSSEDVSAKCTALVAQLAVLTEHSTANASKLAKQAQEIKALESRCTAAEGRGKQLAGTIDATQGELRKDQQDAMGLLDARLESISLQAAEQYEEVWEKLHGCEASWARTRDDDANRIERAIRSLELAIGQQVSEYKREFSSLESTLNHSLTTQTDTHERRCAELKRDIASASAVLRREQTESVAQAQLEAQSTMRDVTMLRHDIEQAQLAAARATEELIAQHVGEQREALLQFDARMVKISAECSDMVTSTRRSLDRQLERVRDTLARQRAEGDAHEAAERERLSSQVEEVSRIVKRTSHDEAEARSALARSLGQQVAASAATAASAADALGNRLDAAQIELEGMVTRESDAHTALMQSVRANLELQLDQKISEVSTSLRETFSELTAATEAKAVGGLKSLQTELTAHRAETTLAMSTQDERLASKVPTPYNVGAHLMLAQNSSESGCLDSHWLLRRSLYDYTWETSHQCRPEQVVELSAVVEERVQALRADIVSCGEAARGGLEQAMAEVGESLSSKADSVVVEQRNSQLSISLAETADKLRSLSDTATAKHSQLRELIDEFDRGMRADFLKSSIGIRKDFAAADASVADKVEEKVIGLLSELRQRLEEAMRSCVSKTNLQVQLATVRLDLNETRCAVQELDDRMEGVRAQSAGVEAELAELAVDLSLMDAATAAMAVAS
jgi:hypothetical protein